MLPEAAKIRIDPAALSRRAARLGGERRRQPLRARPGRGRGALHPAPPERLPRGRRFELGQHLHRRDDEAAAVAWFREAHRLQPDNWTYKRQAWEFVDPVLQGPSEQYEGDWLSDVREIGAENYYPPVDL